MKILEKIIYHGLSIIFFFKLSLYLIPYLLFTIFPLSTLCCISYIMKKMHSNNEFVIMQYIGMSHTHIMKPFLYFGALTTLLHLTISAYLLPISYQHFKQTEKIMQNHYTNLIFEEGAFSNKIENLTIYVGKMLNKNEFTKIFIYDQRKKNTKAIINANKGIIERDEANNKINFLLYNGTYQEYQNKIKKNSVLSFQNYNIEINLAKQNHTHFSKTEEVNNLFIPEMLWQKRNQTSNLKIQTENNSTTKVVEEDRTQTNTDTDTNTDTIIENEIKTQKRILVHGHQRIIWPMYNFIITLIAILILLKTNHHPRHNKTNYKFSCIFALCISIMIMNFLLQNLAFSTINYIKIMYANILLIPIIINFILRKIIQNNNKYNDIAKTTK